MLELCSIREHWTFVQPRLAALIDKTCASWIPEDVFCLCSNGQASLHLDPETQAFCILQSLAQEQGPPVLFIYAAWTPASLSVEDYFPQLSDMAKAIGAEEIKMHGRKGFLRRPEWELDYMCFKRRV
jgi:hypothetical protein